MLRWDDNPVNLVIEVVNELYPGIEADITLIGDEDVEGCCGCAIFDVGTKPCIGIKYYLSIIDSVGTLAHECAHIIVGIDEGHNENWEMVYRNILKEYNRVIAIKANECGGTVRSVGVNIGK